jgi:hypothetical protein
MYVIVMPTGPIAVSKRAKISSHVIPNIFISVHSRLLLKGHFLTLKKEGELTSDEARSVVQEVSSSLMTTLHLWGDPSKGKVNQKVAPRPGALWTPTRP